MSGFSSGQSSSPSQTYADITRLEHQDWKDRFEQFEDMTFDMVDGNARRRMRKNAMKMTTNEVNHQFDAVGGRMEAQNQSLGRSTSEAAREAVGRRAEVGRGAALAQSRNQMSSYLDQREMSLLEGTGGY